MSFLDKLERRWGNLGIPGLMTYLVIGQIAVFMLIYATPERSNIFYLQGNFVIAGEWWRLFTVLLTPVSLSPIWAAFTWYIYYVYGGVLEREWGSFRFTVYILIIYIATIVSAFLFPAAVLSNAYIYSSVFLAFAYLFPDFTLLLFFILPVKIKWLAVIMWIGIAITIATGSPATKALAVLSVSNFLLFFGSDILYRAKDRSRRLTAAASLMSADENYMTCTVCRKTERDRKIFYNCHDCKPSIMYCEDHIKNHSHRIVN